MERLSEEQPIHRCYMAALSVGTLAFFIYLGVYTDFWRTNTEATVIYIAMTLVADATLIEPLFIFFRAFIGYVFYEMANTVYAYVWNVDRETALTLEKVTWKEYVEEASTDKHRPLLSSVIEKKRRSKHVVLFSLFFLLYLMMFLYGYFLYRAGDADEAASKYTFRIMTIEAESGYKVDNWLGEPPIRINEIVDDQSAKIWVVTVFAKVVRTWKNGVNISKTNSRRYWDLSGYSLPQTLTKMITLYQSRNATKDSIRQSKWLKNINGIKFDGKLQGKHYKDSLQETESVVVNGEEVDYEVLSSWTRLTGKTGTSYPLAGNTREFRLIPGKWPSYYAELRRSMAVIFTTEVIIRDHSDLVPRAVILLRKSFVPNLIWVATIDVIIEYLPEGICLAMLNIEVDDIIESPTDRFMRAVNSILLILLLAVNCYIMCSVGPKKYFTNMLFALKGAFLLICFIGACSTAITTSWKIGLVSNMTDIAAPYVKLGYIQTINDWFDNSMTGLSFLVLAFECIVILRYMFQYERMALAFPRCFTMILTGTIILVVIVVVTTRLSLPWNARYFAPILTRIYLKEMFKDQNDTERLREYLFCLWLLTIGFAILNNYFKAVVVYLSERVHLTETVRQVRLNHCGLVKTYQFKCIKTPEPEPEPEPSSSSDLVAPSKKSKFSETMSQKHTFLTRLLYYRSMN